MTYLQGHKKKDCLSSYVRLCYRDLDAEAKAFPASTGTSELTPDGLSSW